MPLEVSPDILQLHASNVCRTESSIIKNKAFPLNLRVLDGLGSRFTIVAIDTRIEDT